MDQARDIARGASANSSGSRVGALEFVNDFPTPDTVGRMRDELKFQAAVQVYLWSMPFMAMMSLRDAHRSVGASTTTIPIFEQFLTAKTVVPTGNQATVYAYNSITLDDEPLVLEVVTEHVVARPGILRRRNARSTVSAPQRLASLPVVGCCIAAGSRLHERINESGLLHST